MAQLASQRLVSHDGNLLRLGFPGNSEEVPERTFEHFGSSTIDPQGLLEIVNVARPDVPVTVSLRILTGVIQFA